MKTPDTQRGEWVNVVGFVGGVKGQAVMLWSAGDVKLGQYEKTVVGRTHVLHGNQHQEDHEKNTT